MTNYAGNVFSAFQNLVLNVRLAASPSVTFDMKLSFPLSFWQFKHGRGVIARLHVLAAVAALM